MWKVNSDGISITDPNGKVYKAGDEVTLPNNLGRVMVKSDFQGIEDEHLRQYVPDARSWNGILVSSLNTKGDKGEQGDRGEPGEGAQNKINWFNQKKDLDPKSFGTGTSANIFVTAVTKANSNTYLDFDTIQKGLLTVDSLFNLLEAGEGIDIKKENGKVIIGTK